MEVSDIRMISLEQLSMSVVTDGGKIGQFHGPSIAGQDWIWYDDEDVCIFFGMRCC